MGKSVVSVLMPYRPDGGPRDQIWAWMRQRYEALLPDYELVVADAESPGRFNEGEAFNRAAAQASGDIFLLAESEVAFNQLDILAAVAAVEAVGGWQVAERYHQLTQERSLEALAGSPDAPIPEPAADQVERSWHCESVSSIVVCPAWAFRLVGGYDERYAGWGLIDKAFAAAMNTLYRPLTRFPGAMFHLWHPRTEWTDANPDLTARYLAAEGDRNAMRRLLVA